MTLAEEEFLPSGSIPTRSLHTTTQAIRYRDEYLWQDRNLPEFLDHWAVERGDKLSVTDANFRLTFAELATLTLRAAQVLLDLGVEPGDVVVVQAHGTVVLPLMNLAAHRVGAVFMPVSTAWREAELGPLLAASKAPVIVVPAHERDHDYAAVVERLRPGLRDLRAILVSDDGEVSLSARIAAAAPADRKELARRRPSPDMPLHAMCSSGTTGLPKISLWSLNNLYTLLADHHARTIERREDEVAAAIAPPNTGSTGYIFTVLTSLLHGDTAHLLERWSPQAALELIDRERCTYAVAVPTQLVMMLGLDVESYDLSALRVITAAGSVIAPGVAQGVEERMGASMSSAYGTSDGGTPMFGSVRDDLWARLNTVGRPQRGEEVRVLDDFGTDAGDGPGELVWRGPTKSFGYLGQPENDATAFDDEGFFHSGDVGKFHDGFVMIMGRLKDMIIRGGVNVYPVEIESALIEHPDVEEVAVVGIPDDRLGEKVGAVLVQRAGTEPLTVADAAALLAAGGFAKYKFPEVVVAIDDMPRNAGGKIDKSHVKRLALEALGL